MKRFLFRIQKFSNYYTAYSPDIPRSYTISGSYYGMKLGIAESIKTHLRELRREGIKVPYNGTVVIKVEEVEVM